MDVRIPSPLRSYTGGAASVNASGDSLLSVLDDLDARYPGIKFRMIDEQGGIRTHIKIFVNTEPAHKLAVPVRENDVIHIVAALSGG